MIYRIYYICVTGKAGRERGGDMQQRAQVVFEPRPLQYGLSPRVFILIIFSLHPVMLWMLNPLTTLNDSTVILALGETNQLSN